MANVLGTVYRWAIPASMALFVGQLSIYDVKGGSRAVIFDRLSGVRENVVNEGTHFLIPWLQKAVIYDVRTKPRNISTTTGSKDLQMVSLTLRVLHRPEVKMLPKIYQVSFLHHFTLSHAMADPANRVWQEFLATEAHSVCSPSVLTTMNVFFPLLGTKC